MLINRKMQTKTKKYYFLLTGIGKMPKFWQDHMLEEMRTIVYWDRPSVTNHPAVILEVSVKMENELSTSKKR